MAGKGRPKKTNTGDKPVVCINGIRYDENTSTLIAERETPGVDESDPTYLHEWLFQRQTGRFWKKGTGGIDTWCLGRTRYRTIEYSEAENWIRNNFGEEKYNEVFSVNMEDTEPFLASMSFENWANDMITRLAARCDISKSHVVELLAKEAFEGRIDLKRISDEEKLEIRNKARAKRGLPPLTLEDK